MSMRTAIVNPANMVAQPQSVQDLDTEQRDELIVSMRKVDGIWVVVSRYGDDIWWLTGSPTNVSKGETKLDFTKLPSSFQAVVKAMMYRYRTRGLPGRRRPSVGSTITALEHTQAFLKYAIKLGIVRLSEISPLICANYAEFCKSIKKPNGQPLSKGYVSQRLTAVEIIYELSQHTDDSLPQHPWQDTSANSISNYGRSRRAKGNTTPLMSDELFTALFQKAWAVVQSAEPFLELRDKLSALTISPAATNSRYVQALKWDQLPELGWSEGASKFISKLLEIRTACYIVVASLSGCRNHELSFIKSNSYYSTEDDDGERFWWMRSSSTKTDEGVTEWMIPEAAVTALQIMDRWAAPSQAMLRRQIDAYRANDVSDPRIAEAQEHLDAIFIGFDNANDSQVRTLSGKQMNVLLKDFATSCSPSWRLSSHQFRRKFANYAARSRFGDLRYLKEHFKHWSFDMTLGYALNESQEMALYLEVEDEFDDLKRERVENWLKKETPLAGGFGKNLMSWRSREENITLFKSHDHMVRSIAESTAIRSNGHAWCTADDQLCDGNDVDPTRCAGGGKEGRGCDSAVVGREHALIYVGLYKDLKTLQNCDDIGEGGQKRVARDLKRCRSTLTTLGHDPLEAVT